MPLLECWSNLFNLKILCAVHVSMFLVYQDWNSGVILVPTGSLWSHQIAYMRNPTRKFKFVYTGLKWDRYFLISSFSLMPTEPLVFTSDAYLIPHVISSAEMPHLDCVNVRMVTGMVSMVEYGALQYPHMKMDSLMWSLLTTCLVQLPSAPN